MKSQKIWQILFAILAIISTFFAISTGNYFGKKFSVEVGQVAPTTIYAPFQIENDIATQRKRELAEQMVKETYTIDKGVRDKAVSNVELLFSYIHAVKTTDYGQEEVNKITILQKRSPIPLYEDEYKTLLTIGEEDLELLKMHSIKLLDELFEEEIGDDDNKSLEIRKALDETTLTAAYQKIVYEIVSSQIKSNIVVDEEATKKERQAAAQAVEPIYILQGEKIIGQGSRITEETYFLLEKMGYLEKQDKKPYTQYLGIGMLLLALALFIGKEVYDKMGEDGNQAKQISLMLIVYMLSLFTIRMFVPMSFIYLPVSVAPMLVAVLMRKDIALMFHVLLVILSAVIHKGDIIFILYLLLAGIMGILILESMQQRKQTVKSAFVVGVIQAFIFIALKFLVGVPPTVDLMVEAMQAFLMGVLSVILVVGSLPLWEAVFGFITPIQLLELTNPNQPVLKRLLIEATGTYYHSLLVANLAEAAADEIGASPLMARVGGYYHDIGKLTCSNYFKENQVIDNPHDYLEPRASASIILSHVTEGIEMANNYKLPKCVKDMIVQHHGTGTMQYFYMKARKNDEENVREEDFSYEGPKPQTKEAGLIMLADVTEATVRAMQHKIGTEYSVEDIVRKMVREKLEEGQLDECPLYISDIEKIIHSFSKMLRGMYHERIEYPERKGK